MILGIDEWKGLGLVERRLGVRRSAVRARR